MFDNMVVADPLATTLRRVTLALVATGLIKRDGLSRAERESAVAVDSTQGRRTARYQRNIISNTPVPTSAAPAPKITMATILMPILLSR